MKDPMNLIGFFTFLSGLVAFYCGVVLSAVYDNNKPWCDQESPGIIKHLLIGFIVSWSICIVLLVVF